MGFLYFGFLRSCLGTMALPAGTCPTRSRASLRISLSRSNFRLRATVTYQSTSRYLRPVVSGHRDQAILQGIEVLDIPCSRV
jgi:hypothetical protein